MPQLYEWVSTGFQVSVVVHHYSIATTHAPRSSDSARPARVFPSPSRRAGSDLRAEESVFEDEGAASEYSSSPGETLLAELRRRLRVLPEEVDDDARFAPREDPWMTWYPHTPPLRSREDPRGDSPGPILWFSSPGVDSAVLLRILGNVWLALTFSVERSDKLSRPRSTTIK